MSTVRLVAAAVTLLLVLAPTTQAHAAKPSMLQQFTTMGEAFWHDRDTQPCPTPQIIIGNPAEYSLQDFDGAADTPDRQTYYGVCRIWLNPELVRNADREHWRPGYGGDSDRETLCATIFHELGHTAGLEHTTTGLMGPLGDAVPYDCHRWRTQQDKHYRARTRRRDSRQSAQGCCQVSRKCYQGCN